MQLLESVFLTWNEYFYAYLYIKSLYTASTSGAFTSLRIAPIISGMSVRMKQLGSLSLDNDQLDAHLLYFTIRPLQSSTRFEHYMPIIRRLHCIDAASGIVLSVSGLVSSSQSVAVR